MVIGALAIAVVSAGIGGAAATAVELGTHTTGNGGGRVIGAAPSVPAETTAMANAPMTNSPVRERFWGSCGTGIPGSMPGIGPAPPGIGPAPVPPGIRPGPVLLKGS
ncbi:hypothetical protein A5682_10435 [Mycobacterium mantenii]|nr:hypothetical protein A5682_10435 [Mycobacterium mantenii]